MPPKKAVKEEKILLGRPGNNLKIGIVGMPNVGVAVPDARFDWLCEIYNPASKVPAYLTVIDIAGLVRGAASGEGLGNNFLSHIQAVDAIFHVVRAFSEEDVTHVEGELDPVRDLEIIHHELRLKDEEFLTKKVESLEKLTARAGKGGGAADKAKKEELEIIQKVLNLVKEEKKDVRKGDWNNKELNEYLYIRLAKIKAWIDENNPGDLLLPMSAALEYRLSTLENNEEREALLKSLETQSALPRIIVTGYQVLQLIYFFTCGPDEVKAWTIRVAERLFQISITILTFLKQSRIHQDFEKSFILAEVMRYEDLKELGTETAVKAAGKYMQKGKEYVVED
ncbi:9286_t:CDS:2, partial [Racocetra fulgida]